MITLEALKSVAFLSQLADNRLQAIALQSAELSLQTGEWLIQEGDVAAFFILLSGRLDVLKIVSGEERVINQYVSGDFFGELPLLLGSRAVASLRAAEPCLLLRLDFSAFQELIAGEPLLSAAVLQAMIRRVDHLRQISIETPASSVTVVGYRWDVDCHGIRDFLARNHVPFAWSEPKDRALLERFSPELLDGQTCPYLIFSSGEVMTKPTLRMLAERFRLKTQPSSLEYDVVIVGAGPAGLAAAVYGASEGLRTLLVEREAAGGQAGTSSRIENYLGFPNGLSGGDLSMRASQQARRFGADIIVTREVTGIQPCPQERSHIVQLDGHEYVAAPVIILATGVSWRKLGLPPEEELIGRGVYYGAARTEALAVRDKDIYLVGAGNSAGQAAMFFTNYARSVTLLVRGSTLESTMSRYLIQQIETKTNIHVELNTEVIALSGADHLEAIVTRDKISGQQAVRPTECLFAFIGADAKTAWLPPVIERDNRGFVLTGRDLSTSTQSLQRWPLGRDPYLLETSVPGVFAAGDVRYGSVKRVASSVGEGSMSIAFAHQYRRSAVL